MGIKEFQDLSVDSPIENFSEVKNWLQDIFNQIGCVGKQISVQTFFSFGDLLSISERFSFE